MPTLKEQIDLIQQNQENNKELEKQIKNILNDHKDLIDIGLKHNLSAANTIDGRQLLTETVIFCIISILFSFSCIF